MTLVKACSSQLTNEKNGVDGTKLSLGFSRGGPDQLKPLERAAAKKALNCLQDAVQTVEKHAQFSCASDIIYACVFFRTVFVFFEFFSCSKWVF